MLPTYDYVGEINQCCIQPKAFSFTFTYGLKLTYIRARLFANIE